MSHFTLTVASMSTLTCTGPRQQARRRGQRPRKPPRQRPARSGVPGRILRAHQLLPAAVGDADVCRGRRRGQRGRRAGDRRAPAGHRGRGACRAGPDAAAEATGPCSQPARCCWECPPWRCWPRRSLVLIVTVSVVRGFGFGLSTVVSGALDGDAGAAAAARRGARPLRRRGHRAGNRGAAGRRVARRPRSASRWSSSWRPPPPWSRWRLFPGCPAGLALAADGPGSASAGCWAAFARGVSGGRSLSSRPAPWRRAWSSPSSRSPPGCPAPSRPPACSPRR